MRGSTAARLALALGAVVVGAPASAHAWEAEVASEEEEEGETQASGAALPAHLVSLTGGVDVLASEGTPYACRSNEYVCFGRSPSGWVDRSGQVATGAAGNVDDRTTFAGGRILVGYDLHFGGLTGYLRSLALGVRAGVGLPSGALLNEPSLHAEGFLKWFPFELFRPTSLHTPRPYVFGGAGVARASARAEEVRAEVFLGCVDLGKGYCENLYEEQLLEAYARSYGGFVSLGAGVIFPLHEHVGLLTEFKYLAAQHDVLAPSAGVVAMF